MSPGAGEIMTAVAPASVTACQGGQFAVLEAVRRDECHRLAGEFVCLRGSAHVIDATDAASAAPGVDTDVRSTHDHFESA
jgi:hypothetical protein